MIKLSSGGNREKSRARGTRVAALPPVCAFSLPRLLLEMKSSQAMDGDISNCRKR